MGSSPMFSTNAISSAVERLAYIQDVVGSNPASRTRGRLVSTVLKSPMVATVRDEGSNPSDSTSLRSLERLAAF